MATTENHTKALDWVKVLTIWILLVALFFAPVLFSGKVLAPLDILDSLLRPWATEDTINVHNASPYDAISQYLPYNWSVYQSIQQDGYIGWNPFSHNGTAILENTMLCPGDWHHQLYRFFSFWDAWNIGIILQFFIAGLGMLILRLLQNLFFLTSSRQFHSMSLSNFREIGFHRPSFKLGPRDSAFACHFSAEKRLAGAW